MRREGGVCVAGTACGRARSGAAHLSCLLEEFVEEFFNALVLVLVDRFAVRTINDSLGRDHVKIQFVTAGKLSYGVALNPMNPACNKASIDIDKTIRYTDCSIDVMHSCEGQIRNV